MSDPAYKVGEVLYVILTTRMSVVPVRVVESNLRTTADGTLTTYTVEDPRGKKSVLKPEWRVFSTPEAVRDELYKNVQKQIDGIVGNAARTAGRWNGSGQVVHDAAAPIMQPTLEEPQMDDDAVALVEMPDGTMAKLKVGSAG